jgi:large subunit ribosomal protein L28
MAKCSICNKKVSFGSKISHSHRCSNRSFKPNIQKVRINSGTCRKQIHICTSCLRSNKIIRAN